MNHSSVLSGEELMMHIDHCLPCTFKKELIESIIKNQFHTFYSLLIDYSSTNNILIDDIILQFKDSDNGTAFHFACQSVFGTNKKTTTKATTTPDDTLSRNEYDNYIRDNDIVSRILFFHQYNNEDLKKMMKKKSREQEHQQQEQEPSLPWLTNDTLNKLIRCKDKNGLTPLMLACQCPIPELCESRVFALLKFVSLATSSRSTIAGSTPPSANTKLTLSRSKIGATALHYLAANHSGINAHTIEALYNDAPIALRTNTNNENGGTPLHWACSAVYWYKKNSSISNSIIPISETSHIETIRTLIRLCMNHIPDYDIINQCDDTIAPALITSLSTYHFQNTKCFLECCIEHLLNIIPTLEYILYPIKVNILHMLVEQDMPSILVTVMEYIQHVDVSILDKMLLHQDHKGKIPLEIAAQDKHLECVVILLRYEQEKDITTSSKDRIDNTPYLFYSSMAIQYIDQYHENK